MFWSCLTPRARDSLAIWFRDARVVLMEFISDGVDRFVGSEVQHQVFGQGSRAVLPALGQLLHLFAELGERFDRETAHRELAGHSCGRRDR